MENVLIGKTKNGNISYFITQHGGEECTGYGIKAIGCGRETEIKNVACNYEKTMSMCLILIKHEVSPHHLKDVLSEQIDEFVG